MGAPTALLDSIRRGFARTESRTGLAAPDPEVLAAIERVPRDLFVPDELASSAWEDRALSIGYGATISQPFIVALMTSLARPSAADRVLEIGTGSGYQTAIIADLVREVLSIEIVPQLRVRSTATLRSLGCDNVEVLDGDGWRGLPRAAPFDIILVTACALHVPGHLRDQLAQGGRMVLPIGDDQPQQELVLVEKNDAGRCRDRVVLPVSFVPMQGRGH